MGILAVGFGEISTLAKTRGSFLDSFCFWALFTKVTGGKGADALAQDCTGNAGDSIELSNLTETLQTGYGFVSQNDTLSWSSDIFVTRWHGGAWRFSSTLKPLDIFDDKISIWNWRPDGMVFIGSIEHNLGFYHLSTGQFTPLEDFDAYSQGFTSDNVTWGSSGIFAGITNELAIKIWQVDTGVLLSTIHTESEVEYPASLSLNSEGDLLAIGGMDGEIAFYDVQTGKPVSTHVYGTESIYTLTWYPHEPWLVGINRAGTLFRVDVGDEFNVTTLAEGFTDTYNIAWSPDSRGLAFHGDMLAIISVGDLTGRLDIGDFVMADVDAYIADIAWSPDNSQIASIDRHNVLSIWNLDEEKEQLVQKYTLSGGHSSITDLEWSPDGQYLATTGWDRTVRIWDGKQDDPLYLNDIRGTRIPALSWSLDSQYLATTASDNQIHILSMPEGESTTILTGHDDAVSVLDWHPSGVVLASADYDNNLNLWDVRQGTIVSSVRFPYFVNTIRWNDVGDKLFVGGDDGLAVMLYISDTYEIVEQTYLYDLSFLYSLEISNAAWQPGGDIVAMTTDSIDPEYNEKIILWDGTPEEKTSEISIGQTMSDMVFSPDPSLLLVARSGQVFTVNVITGEKLASLAVQDGVKIDWNPCQSMLAVGDNTGILHIFEER